MIDLVSYKDSIRYFLSSPSQERTLIEEPKGFENQNRIIYKRDDESKGFLSTSSNDLVYTGEGADFLIRQLDTKGVAEDVLLEKEIKSDDRLDELRRRTTPVYLSLKDLEDETQLGGLSTAKTKVVDGGLKKIIESRKDDVFDLTLTVDSFGNTIPALQTTNLFLEPREIFLRSVLSVQENTEIAAIVSGGDTLNARTVPFAVDVNSDQTNIDFVLGDKLSAASNNYANLSADKIGNCFITSSDNDKKIRINGRVKLTIIDSDTSVGPNHMDIVIYDGFGDFRYKEAIRLVDFDPSNLGEVIQFDFVDYELSIRQGESVTIGLLSDTADGIRYRVNETEIEITEDSVFPGSNCRCLTYSDAINRLLYMITGTNNLLVSDLLTNGELSEDLLTSGFWARQFPDVVNEGTDEERKIPFNVSLNQMFEHIEALVPKAYWVNTLNGQEKLYLELYSYTQQNFDGVIVGEPRENDAPLYFEASQIKRPTIGKMFYGKLILGSKVGGDNYEEVVGLRSINGRAEFATINKNQDAKYEKLSPFALGDIDVELPRRRPYTLFPEEDTRYDSRIMCIRCKVVNGQFVLKKWPDMYEVAPQGIYRPDSAYNLDTTPARLLLKHGANISAAVDRWPQEFIVFLSSNCNSAFVSQVAGESPLAEDQPIKNDSLDPATVFPKGMECTVQITQQVEDQLTGLNKDGVPNWFGIILVSTGLQVERFRLMEADPNKEGKLKLIQAA